MAPASTWRNPHQFRHTFARLAEGGAEGAEGAEVDLMRLAGWRSRAMVARYGAGAADAHARDAHRRLPPATGCDRQPQAPLCQVEAIDGHRTVMTVPAGPRRAGGGGRST